MPRDFHECVASASGWRKPVRVDRLESVAAFFICEAWSARYGEGMTAVVALMCLWIAGFFVWVMSIGWGKVNWLSRILGIMLTLTIVSFANFCVAQDLPFELKGGGPDQGYVLDGHYFVGNHGRYTEVSRRFFINTKRYQHVSLSAFMFLLVTTAAGIAIRVRWFAGPLRVGKGSG